MKGILPIVLQGQLYHKLVIFIPSQLYPVIELARRKNLYKVVLDFEDFLKIKKLSKDLIILTVRTRNHEKILNWTNIKEWMVNKKKSMMIFFKYSNFHQKYDFMQLKRLEGGIKNIHVGRLNSDPLKITKRKFYELASLCMGDTPVIIKTSRI